MEYTEIQEIGDKIKVLDLIMQDILRLTQGNNSKTRYHKLITKAIKQLSDIIVLYESKYAYKGSLEEKKKILNEEENIIISTLNIGAQCCNILQTGNSRPE